METPRLSSLLIFGLQLLSLGAGKEVTLSGQGCCAKSCLQKSTECQGVLSVEKDGKATLFYFVGNGLSKAFHEQICQKPANLKVAAQCSKVGDESQWTPLRAFLVKCRVRRLLSADVREIRRGRVTFPRLSDFYVCQEPFDGQRCGCIS